MKNIKIVLALITVLAVTSCTPKDVKTATKLAGRVLGAKASTVKFEVLPNCEQDTYELESVDGKVIIRGNNAGSMAVGLNRYLQNYCFASFSWYDYNPVELPDIMPAVPEKVRAEANVPDRFFLNYCTFGYTMPWWSWNQWEHFIDWMALNGVNMPLAITGQEAVWQKVWRKYGLTDEQIRSYFVGPAHLPWQRMCNLDRWEGPLPQSWIDGQAALQKKILARERALGMKPILPGFAGHVPPEIADIRPQLDTFRVSYWGGFANEYRCTFLSPMDPEFAAIQKDFLTEQTRMYGTDHIYGVDPFNEVDAPFWDPESLAKIGSGIYSSLTAVDPDAVWLQMGWIFIADPAHWSPENSKAYLTSVPQGKMIILDYNCDQNQIWPIRDSFYGQDFIWCFLDNFGGMTGIEGDIHQASERIAQTAAEAGPGYCGIGATLEGFGVNEPAYEFILSKAWNTGISDEEWIDNLADRHLGRADEGFRAFWHQIFDKVSVSHEINGESSLIAAHPTLEGRWHWTTNFNRGYDNAELLKALDMIEAVDGTSNYYNYDLVNVRRQVMDNAFPALRDKFTAAYKAGNRAAMDAAKAEMLAAIDELDALLATRREFSLNDWIDDARSWGINEAEADYFEKNARTLITVWGDSFHLTDYANRDWAGLVSTYYKTRWEMFFDAVYAAMDAGEPFVNARSTEYIGYCPYGSAEYVTGKALQLDKDIWEFECNWTNLKK